LTLAIVGYFYIFFYIHLYKDW